MQALVAVGLGLGDVVVELAGHRGKELVHARQRRITRADVVDHHTQGPHVEDALEPQALALHLLPDAVQMLGPALHIGVQAGLGQALRQRRARRGDAGFALDAGLVEQAGHAPVVGGLQEAERQVLDLPLDLPYAQPVGQRREHLQRLARQRFGARRPAGGKPAQRLQPRRQPQQHHAQVARERQQHLAHAFGLQGALLGADHRRARSALDLHQLARQRDEAGGTLAERLGDDLFRTLQVVARVDQISRSPHRRRRADGLQQRGHAVGMRQRVLAAVQLPAGQQRLGETPRPRDRVGPGCGVGGAVDPAVGRIVVGQADDDRRLAHRRGQHRGP